MTPLPRNQKPEVWRARRDKARRQRINSAYPQRQLELAVAAQIRKELRDDKRKAKPHE